MKGKACRMLLGSRIRRSTRKRGKATYMGKDLTGARSLQRKLMPDTVGSEQREPTSLRALAWISTEGNSPKDLMP